MKHKILIVISTIAILASGCNQNHAHNFGKWYYNVESDCCIRFCKENTEHTELQDCQYSSPIIVKNSTHCDEGLQKQICLNCGHEKFTKIATLSEHAYNQKNIDNKFKKSETSCTIEYFYSCECGEHGTETFTLDKSGDIKHNNVELIDLNIQSTTIKNPALFKCKDCNKQFIASVFDYEINLPIIDFCGDFSNISKENKIQVSCNYFSSNKNFECDATLKYQGNYSLSYPKKNYSMQFFKKGTNFDKKFKIELFDGCGEQSKYCLKADYADAIRVRNLVGADLSREILFDRKIDDALASLPNGGLVDGFPIVMYQNNVFYGLYNLTIPKDKWMYQMDTNTDLRQAIVTTEAKEAGTFSNLADYNYTNGLDLEFCTTEDSKKIDDSWVVDSFNNIISTVSNFNDIDFRQEIIKYVDLPRTIDVLLITLITIGWDNVTHNVIWTTFDGIKWNPNMYDMDSLFASNLSFNYDIEIERNKLYAKILNVFREEVAERFEELNKSILTKSHIKALFDNRLNRIPYKALLSDGIKWERSISEDVFKRSSEDLSNIIENRNTYIKNILS